MPVVYETEKEDGYYIVAKIKGDLVRFELTDRGVETLVGMGIKVGQVFNNSILQRLIESGQVSIFGYKAASNRKTSGQEELPFSVPNSNHEETIKLLLVATDEAIAELHKQVLSSQGFKVKVAPTFPDAMKCLAEGTFDIVLPTNFGIRPGDIPDFVQWVRRNHPLTGVVIISGWQDSSSETMFGGADAFLKAPVSFELLFYVLKAIGMIPTEQATSGLSNESSVSTIEEEALPNGLLGKCYCKGKNKNCAWCMGYGTVVNGYFSWKDIEACPTMNFTPFSLVSTEIAHRCPQCGAPPGMLRWVNFRSSDKTWAFECGRAGPLSVCDSCLIQVQFFCRAMN